MRTDSTRLSDDAMTARARTSPSTYGAEYLPEAPNVYRTKKRAQDAHEAIRPTPLEWTPESASGRSARSGGRDARETEDLVKLYTLIWQRFVASQMVPAVYDQTTVDMDRGRVGCARPARS